MDFSLKPIKLQDAAGRSFVVISQMDGGFLTRDETTCDLVYLRESEVPSVHEG